MASVRSSGRSSGHQSSASSHQKAREADDRLWEVTIRLRSAINGSDTVDLSHGALIDDDIKSLTHMIIEVEDSYKSRQRAARKSRAAAERANVERNAPDFIAFELDPEPGAEDDAERFEAACGVMWPGDPRHEDPNFVVVQNEDRTTENQLSYRFTPRSQRTGGGHYKQAAHVTHVANRGRAKVLFRHAMVRMSLQQKALIMDAAQAQIAFESGSPSTHHLLLQHNSFGARGTAHLAALVRSSVALETLALGRTPIGDAGAALLGRALPQTRTLRILALQGCDIGSKGIRHLSSGLAHNRSLTSLWLFGNSARDEGAAHLAGALSGRTCRVESLGLEDNGIGTKGCDALALALVLDHCTVSWLRLQHNRLGDDGVSALARALQTNRSLTKLQLRDVGVGASGCTALAEALLHSKTLQTLSLEDNDLSSAMTEPLLRAMQQSAMLATLSLDLTHGGQYDRVHTREELEQQMTLAFLGLRGNHGFKGSAAGKKGSLLSSMMDAASRQAVEQAAPVPA